jgi:hypothetical protein
MRRMIPSRALRACASAGFAAIVFANVAADAQIKPPPPVPNQVQVYLVRLDFSDCANSNVPNVDSPAVGGNVWVTRGSDGNTTLKIALTASPKTTYHFFLKCVRQLGDIPTDEEGVGLASFSFPTNSAGNVYAFDSYPDGAPAGNKFQSAQVKFP